LKSSGFNLEEWQQKDPKALFRRLLIVSYASVLVWKIANENSISAVKTRKFLSDKKEISQFPPLLRTTRATFTASSSSINN
ncbi:MAG: hypothetical protein U9N33_08235, partial [Campylobacterota bacterium]|nr:hypothetical protein [Campylobacterota bacterium]